MTWKVRSTFSGVGGIDLGLERAGMEVISQCEFDEYRRKILRRHWPDVEVADDVQSVSYEKGSCDLLVGGFPCQDLSVAGRRAGVMGGARSGLFFEFARIADECVPEGGWILIENVPGLFSSPGKDKDTGEERKGRDLAVLFGVLVDLGFHDIAWRVLDSRYFGVPQRRRRVFILARRAAGHRAAKVLLEPEGDGGHPQEGRKKGKKRPRAAAPSTGNGSGSALAGAGEGASVANGLTKRYGKGTDSDATDAMVVFNLRGRKEGAQPEVDPDGLASVRASNGGSSRSYIASALDRMRGGADDNDAQANHIIPVGLGADSGVSGTLGKKGIGGGGLGLDREGAFVVEKAEGFNWQSGGDVRLQIKEGEVPTIQTQQVPAVHVVVAPDIAAPLTRGHATGAGVSVPGRRKEDDVNIVGVLGEHAHTLTSEGMDASEDGTGRGTPVVAFGAWNMQIIEGAAGTLLGGSRGAQYSLNNMPLVAKCLTSHSRWDYDTEDFIVHAEDEAGTIREHVRNNSNPVTEAKQHVIVRPRAVREGSAISENQRAEVNQTSYSRQLTTGGGKPGQGYPAAHIGDLGMVRRLTPTECERLQGFPDGWTLAEGDPLAAESSWYEVGIVETEDGKAIIVPRVSDIGYLDRLLASMMGAVEIEEPAPDGRRYAAMGDAVTVPVAHWIGARLLAFGAD